MWCPHARLDTFLGHLGSFLCHLGRFPPHFGGIQGQNRAHNGPKMTPKMAKNGQNDVKIDFFFLIFSNGPKWINVASKWSKMAPKRIFGPFGLVFVAFGPVPPSLLGGYPPSGWGHPALPGIWLGGTPLEPTFALCGHRQGLAPGCRLPEWPHCCSNGFYIVQEP